MAHNPGMVTWTNFKEISGTNLYLIIFGSTNHHFA